MSADMPGTLDGLLLDALLDSWDRNTTILINLLRALPEGGMEARATDGSPTVAQLFMHVHFVRLVLAWSRGMCGWTRASGLSRSLDTSGAPGESRLHDSRP